MLRRKRVSECVCREVEKKAAKIKKRVNRKEKSGVGGGRWFEECCKLVGQKEVSGW